MAHAACERARAVLAEQGSVGAGTGTTVGKALGAASAMKGGLGCATAEGGGVACLALAVVNALGDVRDASGRIVAGARGADGAFVDVRRVLAGEASGAAGAAARRFADATTPAPAAPPLGNTTLALVATTVPLDRVALAQLARAAGAALVRRITPCGTSFDGDVVFAVGPLDGSPAAAGDALRAETLAVAALEEAIERAVRHAVGRDGVPGLADAT
jgi:L-aminopeptidase/D-esterase-like protein